MLNYIYFFKKIKFCKNIRLNDLNKIPLDHIFLYIPAVIYKISLKEIIVLASSSERKKCYQTSI